MIALTQVSSIHKISPTLSVSATALLYEVLRGKLLVSPKRRDDLDTCFCYSNIIMKQII
jgi:hypothetical protein